MERFVPPWRRYEMFTIKNVSTEPCVLCDKTDTVEIKGKRISGVFCWDHVQTLVKRNGKPPEAKADADTKARVKPDDSVTEPSTQKSRT